MSTAFLTVARSSGRTGLHLLVAGALAVAALTLALPTGAHAASVDRKHSSGKRVAHAVRIAQAQKGDRYVYGAAGPSSFDCSGLTYYSYRKAGFKRMPRTSSAQAGFARRISRSAMSRGDLIFFANGGGVYHVGIYMGRKHGHRTVLHSAHPGTRVGTDPLWTNGWFPGTLRHR